MKYLPPFELIRRSIEISTVRGELRVNVSYEDFVRILRTLIGGIEVNDAWYLKTYTGHRFRGQAKVTSVRPSSTLWMTAISKVGCRFRLS